MTDQATTIVFRSTSGKAFAFLNDRPWKDGDVLYSPDGETFYALALRGQSSSTEGGVLVKMDLSFDDPHHGVSGRLHYDGNVITYDDETFAKQTDAPDLTVVPLPAARRVEYFCQSEDGTLYYVSSDQYNYSYESFRLFIGNGTTMREVPVENVARYRDGGTTYIRTPEGTFFSPSPFNEQRDPNLVPQWDEQKLVNLNTDDYHIVEADGDVSISKR